MATTSSRPPSPYKILISYALDETGDLALSQGLRVAAGRADCELHLVHVVDEPPHLTKEKTVSATDEHLQAAKKAVGDRLAAIWKDAAKIPVIAHIRPGKTVDAILQCAADIAGDLVIVGTHRRAGLEKLVLGSIAEQVVKRAPCPVLIAVPKDYSGLPASASIAPPCPDCLKVRAETNNETYWCERHSQKRERAHLYQPHGGGRHSVMPTY